MALAVSELEEILHALELLDNAYIRFLSVLPSRSINRVDEVVQLESPWDHRSGVRDIFSGRLLSFGWSSSRSESREPALLDLRFQISGVHEWPHMPVVGLWQRTDDEKSIGGVLLVGGYVLGERHAYVRDEASCTTVRIAVPTARLLQGPS
jgi:hypothetical protein